MIGEQSAGRLVAIGDTRLWVQELGAGHPILVLHGGPGLDHTQFRPWLDPLAKRFRLFYVDQRSQGRSGPADESTWTLKQMAADVSALAEALSLEAYAVLGHSFGSFVALQHAVDHATATHYVLAGCVPSSRWLDRIERNLATFEPVALREQVSASWDRETEVQTEEEFRQLFVDQLPFHFADPEGSVLREFANGVERMRLAPAVLRTLSQDDYGAIEVEDRLGEIEQPVLVVAAEHDRVCVPDAGWAIAEHVQEGECVLLKDAGHMMFVEKPKAFRGAIEAFFDRFPPP